MKRWLILIVALLILAPVSPTFAQGGEISIAYGDKVQGEITNAQFEVAYRFPGSANDLVVIQMVGDAESSFYDPMVILLDSENTVLLSAQGYSEGATLMTHLPEDGSYVVLASRYGGRTGDGVGNYSLSLDLLLTLKLDEGIIADITSEQFALHAIELSGPFMVEFERLEGEFAPEMSINVLSEVGELETLGRIHGSTFGKVTAVVEPDQEAPSDLYIIRIAKADLDWYYDVESARYQLAVTSVPVEAAE